LKKLPFVEKIEKKLPKESIFEILILSNNIGIIGGKGYYLTNKVIEIIYKK
jgi:hypothetical protein